MTRARAGLLILVAISFLPASCTSLQRNYGVPLPGSSDATPEPSGSGTGTGVQSSASPSDCATQNPNAGVVVAMVSFVTPTAEPTYGAINGYAVLSDGTVPAVAQEIDVSPGTVVQFVNGEDTSSPAIVHSAVGIPGNQFPAVPYAFPSASAQSEGTEITAGTWSTGVIQPGCYSASFTVPNAGTFLFGDDTYYNLSNTRDLVVSSNSNASARRAVRRIR